MKANALISVTALALLMAGCASQPKQHPKPIEPVLRPVKPTPLPPPVSIRPPPGDWRDQPRTAGDWRWRTEGTRSIAAYGSVFSLSCTAGQRALTIELAAQVSTNQIIVITTTSLRRALTVSSPGDLAVATIPANDPLIDAMAFSRGRFMVETGGSAPLYLPSWPEISRVTEDCR